MFGRRMFALLVLWGGLLLPGLTWADDYKEALKAIQRSDWMAAKSKLQPLADTGHVGAEFSIGLMYQMGRGVEKDLGKAMEYYLRCADKGFSPAENNIGLMYKLGIGVTIDYPEAVKWFARAAKDHSMARMNLGEMYEKGQGVEQDDAKAAALYLQCAEDGTPACQYRAARALETGRGVGKDWDRAKVLYYASAALGYNLSERKIRLIEAEEGRAKREGAK